MDCRTHKIHKIKCPANKNDFSNSNHSNICCARREVTSGPPVPGPLYCSLFWAQLSPNPAAALPELQGTGNIRPWAHDDTAAKEYHPLPHGQLRIWSHKVGFCNGSITPSPMDNFESDLTRWASVTLHYSKHPPYCYFFSFALMLKKQGSLLGIFNFM